MGWLHHTAKGSDTCIVILHGHNANGARSRFQTIAKWLEHHGYNACRWNCIRPVLDEKTYSVLPISTEIAQARALVKKLRERYPKIILVGHSQGGLVALQLATEGYCDALVQLMAVVDTRENVRSKFAHIGVNLEELHNIGTTKTTYPNGESFVYDAGFFENLVEFDAHALYKQYTKPLLMVGALRDDPVPLSEVQDGFSWANEPKELLVIDDLHNFSDENAMLIAKKIAEWLR